MHHGPSAAIPTAPTTPRARWSASAIPCRRRPVPPSRTQFCTASPRADTLNREYRKRRSADDSGTTPSPPPTRVDTGTGADARTPARINTPAPGALLEVAALRASLPGHRGTNRENRWRWNASCASSIPTTVQAGYQSGWPVRATRHAPDASAAMRGTTSNAVMRRALPTPMAYQVIDMPDRAAETHINAASQPVPGGESVTDSATTAGVTIAQTPARSHHAAAYVVRRSSSCAASATAGGPTTCQPNIVTAVAKEPTACPTLSACHWSGVEARDTMPSSRIGASEARTGKDPNPNRRARKTFMGGCHGGEMSPCDRARPPSGSPPPAAAIHRARSVPSRGDSAGDWAARMRSDRPSARGRWPPESVLTIGRAWGSRARHTVQEP